MQISLLLTQEIIKLFAIMLMGYFVVKAGLLKAADSKSISVILVYLVIPCVIIKAFQVDYTADIDLSGDDGPTETNFLSRCHRAGDVYLFQCRHSGDSSAPDAFRTGLRHLF